VNGTGFLVTNGSGSNYTAFFVNATSGNVGIGTANPNARLDIQLPTSGDVRVKRPSGTNAYRLSLDSNQQAQFLMSNIAGTDVIQLATDTATSGDPTYFNSGKVGIGNTKPNVTLDVSGNVNVSGRLSYGTLAANSPHFLETMGSPEPLCVKSSSGKYVGCMVDENFEFECRVDDRCNRKYLDSKLAEEVEKLSKEIDESQKEAKQVSANTSQASSSLITGNAINEAGLETDLSNILEPEINAAISTNTTAETTAEASIVVENNSNVQTFNASGDNAASAAEPIADNDEKMTMTDTTYKYINQTGSADADKEINQKIERLSRIRSDIKEKKVTVKQAIERLKAEKLKHIDLDEIEDEETAEAEYTAKKAKEGQATTIIQQAPQQDYMTKVNGSIILRLG